ncbi:hypothetical protein SRB17_02750 [Streptomyces sp. RB17]|uniref:hypothetical protein n=1 Tax=Streptomyces sp. RB17 TaxID=2585197 RepID=UPI0012980703|nr:hypothetical protein [Streptomyces sp. RB17]MQY32327.1 hypothetical protein [Streptomyces sp. RB17]
MPHRHLLEPAGEDPEVYGCGADPVPVRRIDSLATPMVAVARSGLDQVRACLPRDGKRHCFGPEACGPWPARRMKPDGPWPRGGLSA